MASSLLSRSGDFHFTPEPFAMRRMIFRIPVWLLLLGYLMAAFGGVVPSAVAQEKTPPCTSTGGGCAECCAADSSPSHLRSTPATKRLPQAPVIVSPLRVAAPPLFDVPALPALHCSLLPNSTLVALRTVVLLN